MMTRNRFLLLTVVASALYLVLHLLLNDVFLYAIGGAIGVVLKIFSKQVSESLFIFTWIVLLGMSVFFYYRIKSQPIKYLFLLLIFFLMYVIDLVLYKVVSNAPDTSLRIFNTAVMVLVKGLVLSLIVYFERRPKKSLV